MIILLLLFTLLGFVAGGAYEDGKIGGRNEAFDLWTGYEDDCANAADPRECLCSYAWDFDEACQE
jgi:hypothetical protein